MTYWIRHVNCSSRAICAYIAPSFAVETTLRYEPPVSAASRWSGPGENWSLSMPIGYTVARAARAAATARASVALLAASRPSVNTMMTRAPAGSERRACDETRIPS